MGHQFRIYRRNDPQQKAGRSITKLYRALVSGIIIEDEVIIDQPIGLVRYPGVAKGLYVASPSGFVISIKYHALP
ncbi:UNVERIFIED_CONTAM: RNA pseudouridine synthase 5 [Sesamum radiatum]|uniref:RNA pseudouridine synthase 5 n=1 Tax=Sesamum radiatum TaxID=300843 RepID=A0AAW2NEA8_SESRA